MKGYRKPMIKPGVPELAARRKKAEDDRRFLRAISDLQSQRNQEDKTAQEGSKQGEGKND